MRRSRLSPWSGAIVVAALLMTQASARAAEPKDSDDAPGVAVSGSVESAVAGAFSFLTQSAQVDRQRALAVGFGGYDGAAHSGVFETTAEVTLFGPVAIRGGAAYSPAGGRVKPSVGAKLQVLHSAVHGLDGTVGVFYRPEGLTEPEGEIEALAAIGGTIGRNYLFGNLLYGQDPDGRERDGEVRASVLRRVTTRVLLGFDGRCRFDLGSDTATLAAHGESTFDALVGPAASVLFGRVALLAQAGASIRRISSATAYGPFAIGGVGTIF